MFALVSHKQLSLSLISLMFVDLMVKIIFNNYHNLPWSAASILMQSICPQYIIYPLKDGRVSKCTATGEVCYSIINGMSVWVLSLKSGKCQVKDPLGRDPGSSPRSSLKIEANWRIGYCIHFVVKSLCRWLMYTLTAQPLVPLMKKLSACILKVIVYHGVERSYTLVPG